MEEKINEIIKLSKEVIYFLKRKMNTTKRISVFNYIVKHIEINQDNIIYLAEMLKDIDSVKENISEQKLDKLFKRIEKDVERSYQF